MIEITGWVGRFLAEFWYVTAMLAPWLFLGFAVAGVVSLVLKPSVARRWLARGTTGDTVRATLLGVPMPLCSCGVIPVALMLRRQGASRGATAAFLASTPQTGVDSIAATWGIIGPGFALLRGVVAAITGLLAGGLISLLKDTPQEVGNETTGSSKPVCGQAEAREGERPTLRAAFRYGFVDLMEDIARPLLLGLLLAALASTFLEPSSMARLGNHPLAVYVSVTLVSIPLYVCSTGSLPLAFAMLQAGLSPGAALIFLVAGPATNAATLAATWRTLGRTGSLLYLLSILIAAWGVGFAVDAGWATFGAPLVELDAMEHLGWWEQLGGALLLAILAWRMLIRPLVDRARRSLAPEQLNLTVDGMACEHCASKVRAALEDQPGVRWARVDFKRGEASVGGKGVTRARLAEAVEGAGFRVREA